MTVEEAINILEIHNKWRRGELDRMPYGPRKVGEAIDTVVAVYKGSVD